MDISRAINYVKKRCLGSALKACGECGQIIDWSDYIAGDNI